MKKLPIIALIAVIGLYLTGCQSQQANAVQGKEILTEFSKEHFPGYNIVAASVSTMDTNNDGYITGTLTIQRPGEKEFRVLRVEVPEQGDPLQIQKGHGCKLSNEQFFDNRF